VIYTGDLILLGWACSSNGGDKKFTLQSSEETSWKTEKCMENNLGRWTLGIYVIKVEGG
jgi:hypothetical protein